MAHGVPVLALLVALGASTLSQAQEQELPVSEVAPKIFVHAGQIALMTRENEGVFVIHRSKETQHREKATDFALEC